MLEALFLAAVAAALTVGDPNAPTVIGVMLLAWLLVALFEWASWLDEPHFGRGLPPRYVVPQAALPPPRLVEQGRRAEAAPPLDRSGYPEPATDDTELTWVVGPGEWGPAPGVRCSRTGRCSTPAPSARTRR